MQLSVIGAASEVRPYSYVMLQIVVEVAGTVCDADCSIFAQRANSSAAKRTAKLLPARLGNFRPP